MQLAHRLVLSYVELSCITLSWQTVEKVWPARAMAYRFSFIETEKETR